MEFQILRSEKEYSPVMQPIRKRSVLNVGSVNLGKSVYKNPIDDVEYCVGELIREDKRPEIEVFELGMINTVRQLDEKFHFVDPILFALVFGHGGEMPATENALRHMKEYLYETFLKMEKSIMGLYRGKPKRF